MDRAERRRRERAFKKRYGILAQYRCQKCGRFWEQLPGPTECACGYLYLDWDNYEEVRAAIDRRAIHKT